MPVVLSNSTKACLGMMFNKSVFHCCCWEDMWSCAMSYSMPMVSHTIGYIVYHMQKNSCATISIKDNQDFFHQKSFLTADLHLLFHIIWNVLLQLQSIFFPPTQLSCSPAFKSAFQIGKILIILSGMHLVSSDLL